LLVPFLATHRFPQNHGDPSSASSSVIRSVSSIPRAYRQPLAGAFRTLFFEMARLGY
jgi:hypothetical protein